MINPTEVILVNEQDEAIGTMEKRAAHEEGLLHRAISIFVFTPQGDLILQRRAHNRQHCGGLWSNTCCGHPLLGEDITEAAHRKLQAVLGFDTHLDKQFEFRYRLAVTSGIVENEYKHIYFGQYNGPIHPDPKEVVQVEPRSIALIKQQIQHAPGQFTPWFRLLMPSVLNYL
ncbi:isopentenyl-diphosphate delta-isomerase [Chitinophaga skermanii]|uniref:Isopentenyl-diphosphate delta-isomerase n=1 Tax=Chitinophaga skermanii TaxID=331697 RepID=A0A327QKY3_9BACT|nr:isopentenyl-diphosphate Delta-isomerase [Chitinophaga skermanii]RAJ05199.1 isopentenyl-diphosphate delta-isomerase [Chitinophaga skermanii]